MNDVSVINKILSKYNFTKHLTLSPIDPGKTNKKSRVKNSREPITEKKRNTYLETEKSGLDKINKINLENINIGKENLSEAFNQIDKESKKKNHLKSFDNISKINDVSKKSNNV